MSHSKFLNKNTKMFQKWANSTIVNRAANSLRDPHEWWWERRWPAAVGVIVFRNRRRQQQRRGRDGGEAATTQGIGFRWQQQGRGKWKEFRWRWTENARRRTGGAWWQQQEENEPSEKRRCRRPLGFCCWSRYTFVVDCADFEALKQPLNALKLLGFLSKNHVFTQKKVFFMYKTYFVPGEAEEQPSNTAPPRRFSRSLAVLCWCLTIFSVTILQNLCVKQKKNLCVKSEDRIYLLNGTCFFRY